MYTSMVGGSHQAPRLRQDFFTRGLPQADQFDAWRQFNSGIIELVPVDDPAGGFDVEHCWWGLGDLVLANTKLPGAPVRAWRHRKRSSLDHWCVEIAKRAGERGEITSSDVGLRSLTRPFNGRRRDAEVICLYVPRRRLPAAAGALESKGSAVLSAGGTRILTAHLESLVRDIDSVPQAAWSALAEGTCALLAACLLQTPECVAVAQPSMHAALRARARKIVAANLSPDFGPTEMARLLFVSRSKLYRIFEADGGVARFIQRERLAYSNRILTEATSRISISALSLEVGFRDHAAFSRAYKSEYGICPREARDAMLARRIAGEAADPGALAPRTLADGAGRLKWSGVLGNEMGAP